MSEPKPSEQYHVSTEETQEAMEMLGKGYEKYKHPSVVIEPPHVVMERRGNEFQEVITPAFVKISTDFKGELAGVDEIALKVWLYIALSVNRYSGKANPGLRTIAQGTGFAINTIQSALKRLENDYKLLTVDRESRKYNIYEPVAFVSANRKEPVSPDDTVQISVSDPEASVSVLPASVSVEAQSVSPRLILNQINQIKPDVLRKPNFQKLTPREAAGISELQRFEEATGYFPGQPLWEVIYNDLHTHKWTVEQIRKPWVEWCKRGYNTRSLSWMEWIGNPIPDRHPSYANNGKAEPSNPVEWRKERERKSFERLAELEAQNDSNSD